MFFLTSNFKNLNPKEFECTKCQKHLTHLDGKFFMCVKCSLIFEKQIAKNWGGDLKSYKRELVLVTRKNVANFELYMPKKLFESNNLKILDYEKTMQEGV